MGPSHLPHYLYTTEPSPCATVKLLQSYTETTFYHDIYMLHLTQRLLL